MNKIRDLKLPNVFASLFVVEISVKNISKIYKIKKNQFGNYIIEFKNNNKIYLSKKRTIIGLLVLLYKGSGTESDISKGNTTINKIKKILKSRLPKDFVQDYYKDANKPFSELWNEEGFSFIKNVKRKRFEKSQSYTLIKSDIPKLFKKIIKINRVTLSKNLLEKLLSSQKKRCNFCGSILKKYCEISENTFAKDHVRAVADHRVPVEKGVNSSENNFQYLCFYCNKSKWQVCNYCVELDCNECALAFPEVSNTVKPTKENIKSRLSAYNINKIT